MWWFLTEPARLLHERDAIDRLAAEDIGIENIRWRHGPNLALRVEADLRIDEEVRSVAMTYPLIYPNAPPAVCPIGELTEWDAHQYRSTGDLCLEYRADNWHPDLTGAVMLRSALTLMAADMGLTHQSGWALPSAHNVTPGQQVRWNLGRMNTTAAGQAKLSALTGPRPIVLYRAWGPASLMVTLVKMTEPNGSEWIDTSVPTEFIDEAKFPGLAVPVALDDERLDSINRHLKKDGNSLVLWMLFVGEPITDGNARILVLSLPTGLRAFHVYADSHKPFEYAIIAPDAGQRLPPRNAALAEKTFAILGCGSLGSKVAASLARSGARKFILVDPDVLTLGNLVRNDLDGGQAGASKADVVAERLKRVAAGVEVAAHKFMFGGQEPGSEGDSLVRAIGAADVIVDMTGDDGAFNYAASAAQFSQKAMCWGHVFGGGFGGLIARVRPGLDPNPFDARAMIAQWCDRPEFPEPPPADRDYGALSKDGPPMVADDADVSAIAAHFTRLVIDTAIGGDKSDYECSAYMIGLRKEWIFERPFDTWPIDLGTGLWINAAEVDPEVRDASLKMLMEILNAPETNDSSSADA